MSSILSVKGVGPAVAKALQGQGITSPAHLAAADPEALKRVRGIGTARATQLVAQARAQMAGADVHEVVTKPALPAPQDTADLETLEPEIDAKEARKAAKAAKRAAKKARELDKAATAKAKARKARQKKAKFEVKAAEARETAKKKAKKAKEKAKAARSKSKSGKDKKKK
jgi:predicted RecB family nuclease